MNEMPTLAKSSYSSSAMTLDSLAFGGATSVHHPHHQQVFEVAAAVAAQPQPPHHQQGTPVPNARIVKVFIADSNENIPLENRLLYSGTEKLTDLNDNELFFELPISELLAKHNELRKATRDKKQSAAAGKDIFLEPARIRDLKMVVVDVAVF
jgi:hypothetical protein